MESTAPSPAIYQKRKNQSLIWQTITQIPLFIEQEADVCDREARGYTTRASNPLKRLAERFVAPYFKADMLFLI